ncbi:hypothetical protein SAMN00790413_00441 [Deinococcus hopiensis KR-140]|uniref:Uncharacterized protein n=1 Tax=Deinococcus hopiensis KR-140 TaxID=695939 RepID=A0A1W1V8A9_9DEIO|nr:hypothetical protein SAMN00790413_00441 [Deinococcus hopiensis KR-140]
MGLSREPPAISSPAISSSLYFGGIAPRRNRVQACDGLTLAEVVKPGNQSLGAAGHNGPFTFGTPALNEAQHLPCPVQQGFAPMSALLVRAFLTARVPSETARPRCAVPMEEEAAA